MRKGIRTIVTAAILKACRLIRDSNAVLGEAFRQREPHLKARVAGFRADLNVPPVLLHNSLNGVEAEPRTFPDSLSGEERFENVRLYAGQDSRPVIADFDHDAIILPVGADSEPALSAHGVNCVVDEVGPNLIQLAAE